METTRKTFHAELHSVLQNLMLGIQCLKHSTEETTTQDPVPKSDLELRQDHLLIKRSALGMVKSTESLLSLLSHLKQSLLLQDVEYLNSLIGDRKANLSHKIAENQLVFTRALDELKSLQQEYQKSNL